MSKYDQLFGKALQTIVTVALQQQNIKGTDKITLGDLTNYILEIKPELIIFVSDASRRRKFKRRVFNCVKQLSEADLLEIQKIKAAKGIYYYIIFTKIK